jgi:hypothetical protein
METNCLHQAVCVGGLEVVACDACRTIEWYRGGRGIDPMEGMAALFGDFDLVGSLPAVFAPSTEVLLYRPGSRHQRQRFDPFPRESWLRATPDLWMSHDGEHLVLAPTDPLTFTNLTRGA